MEGASTEEQDGGPVGECTIEPVGLIPGTARFRGEFTGQIWIYNRDYTLTRVQDSLITSTIPILKTPSRNSEWQWKTLMVSVWHWVFASGPTSL